MVFDLMTMAVWDGELAAVFNSPFVIPVAGCLMILGIVASGSWARVRSMEIKSQERLARIAHGLPVEPNWDEATVKAATAQPAGSPALPLEHLNGRPSDGSGARRAGTVLTSIGVGLFAFFGALATILRVRAVLAGGAAGLIPLAIGLGFLIDARLKKQEYERRMHLQQFPAWNPAFPESHVPPPPPGMTAAQASDWRPSSTLKDL